MSADGNLPRNVLAPRKSVVSSGFGGAAVVQLPPKPLPMEASTAQSEPTRLSEKEKLEKRLFQNEITVERADKIKSAFVLLHNFRGVSTERLSIKPRLCVFASISLKSHHISNPFLRALSC